MEFHSIGIGGDIAEMFDMPTEDYGDCAWEIVPAYDADQAVRQMQAKIRGWVQSSLHMLGRQKAEWDIRSYASVTESDVIKAAKNWDVSF